MSRFRLRIQLLIVSLSLMLGFALFGAWTYLTIEKAKVGGPEYQRVVLYKDLIADILPPPNYIIESYLTVIQLADPDRAVEHDALIAKLAQLRKDYDGRNKFWQEQTLPAEIRQSFLGDAHGAAQRFYETADKDFIPAVRESRTADIRSALANLEKHYAQHRQAIDRVVASSLSEQTAVETKTAADLKRDLWLLVLVFVLSAALGAITNALFGRSLLSGIARARQRLGEIAAGSLTVNAAAETRPDEVGDLLRTLDDTAGTLRRTVTDIHTAAETVSSAAEQLSATIAAIAEGANQQSSAVASVAGTLEEMSSGIIEMAERSVTSKQRGVDAGTRCEQGQSEITGTAEVVGRLATDVQSTAESINALGERSREISGIVGVIREIADQTNLLALNAAIEAARAGEQGRGFAVVADEVRKLAERTAQSTDQIGRMIVQIQQAVDVSVRGMSDGSARARSSIDAVHSARQTMEGIAGETRSLVIDIQEIATQLDAQRRGSEEIVQAVTQIAGTTEETSAATSQVAGTANDLAATAQRLRQSVEFFRL